MSNEAIMQALPMPERLVAFGDHFYPHLAAWSFIIYPGPHQQRLPPSLFF
jgi:hypothetical protein